MRALLISTYDLGRQPVGLGSPASWLKLAGCDVQCVDVAKHFGAVAVSFWSWQHANPPAWDAIRDGPSFLRPPDQPAAGG